MIETGSVLFYSLKYTLSANPPPSTRIHVDRVWKRNKHQET